ncbi:MAG TPA: phenylpyruvate tautomerase MIF-related protein [Polyangia bacterium]|nr:phenylpyruvate tautomerase MIF-related protein [Polyangia bacterium]
MPLVQVFTSAPAPGADAQKALLASLSKLLAARFQKPERWVMTCLCPDLAMTFGGTPAPAAFAAVRNVGKMSADELEMVKSGLSDMVLKKPQKVELDTYGPKVDALARKRGQERVEVEKVASKKFLESAGRESGAVVSPSGLVFKTVTPGTGPSPSPTDKVTVHYEGRLTDGTVFDSSRKRNMPATFPLNGVIKCWTEGVGRMKVGEKAVLTCPSAIAYGDSGRPPTIPGGATLIFDVELLSIQPADSPAPQAPPITLPPQGQGGPHGGLQLNQPKLGSPGAPGSKK